MRRLVELSLMPEGEVNQEVAALILRGLSRTQLKKFLSALRRELARRRVYVSVSGATSAEMRDRLGASFAGKEMTVSEDGTLGGGMRVRAGADLIDASVSGYIRETIRRLGKE